MYKFEEFNIKPRTNSYVGEKIKVQKLLNRPINVLDYKIEPSKQKTGTELLTLQIELGGEKRVVFTGSTILIQMIKQVQKDNFPFQTTILGDNDYYEFS